MSGLLAAGMIAAATCTAFATSDDYLSRVNIDILGGYVNKVEVGLTFNQIIDELRSRGYDVRTTGSDDPIYNGARLVIITPKSRDFIVYVEGDINCDGRVDASDQQIILDYLAAAAGGTEESVIKLGSKEFEAADIDQDGYITISDLMSLIKIISRHAND